MKKRRVMLIMSLIATIIFIPVEVQGSQKHKTSGENQTQITQNSMDSRLEEFAALTIYEMIVDDSPEGESQILDYYVVDNEHERIFAILHFGLETETYEYIYPEARVVDMLYYYEEDFDVLNTFDVALEDFYDKVGQLEESLDGRYVQLDETYQQALFENYFAQLIDTGADYAFDIEEDQIVRLSYEKNSALMELFELYSPFNEELTDFELILELDLSETVAVSYERYEVDNKEVIIGRQFSEAMEEVPALEELRTMSQDDFDQLVLELGLPLY